MKKDWSVGTTCSTHNHPTRYWETAITGAEGLIGTSSAATQEEAEQIARLFAASPDLLDVAHAITVQFRLAGYEPEENSNNPLKDLLFRADKAMAKVAGASR